MVLGSCALNNLKRRRKADGLKRKRLERFDPLETSSLYLMKKAMI